MKGLCVAACTLVLAAATPLTPRENTCTQGSKTPYGALTHSACPCWNWYEIQTGDGDCGKVASKFGVSREDVIRVEPGRVTPPNPLPTPPCNAADAPYPVGKGTVCGCKKWYRIRRGDDCGPVASEFGISADQLIEWNPWLSADVDGTHYPCMNIWPTDNLCVDVSSF
ncbi:ErfK/YbiS/YcfS/YnhG family protein [Beauveria bassiana ARSEF 2860]|uniref:Secreted LysM effector Blys6 n=1 Tax=Beauveria bassiana (strain ARSEF 2860) TaxID=655819 RepID=LYSM6_BEAB2|nr:ErfK/YbiS/YcfS/YnhG family protein [Beauveria bassiana ARSEF 2860]EJP62326.1 ErfK/YbiS/YcfS/YnhG family protein [Beauveria bassiana ARSEF 2860]